MRVLRGVAPGGVFINGDEFRPTDDGELIGATQGVVGPHERVPSQMAAFPNRFGRRSTNGTTATSIRLRRAEEERR